MSKHQGFSEVGTEVPIEQASVNAAAEDKEQNSNVVVKRERLFNLLQEEHLQERLAARETSVSIDTPSAGVFRLYGADPLPDLRPMEAENKDPTSQGVVTFR